MNLSSLVFSGFTPADIPGETEYAEQDSKVLVRIEPRNGLDRYLTT